MDRPALHRRGFLAAVAATAGCADLVDDRDQYHHETDAPISASVPSGPWPTLYHDRRNSSYAPDLSGPGTDATVDAVAVAGKYLEMAPAVATDRLHLGVDRMETDDGEFSGFRAVPRRDGTESWRVAEDLGMGTPTVHRNAVFVTAAGRTRALDRRDGSVCWSYPAGVGHHHAAPVVDGSSLYVSGTDHVHALDARTGEERWRSDAVESAVSGVAAARGRICATTGGGGDGTLLAFDPGAGQRAWEFPRVGESYAPPVVDEERAYVMNTSGVLYAVSLDDGTEQWRFGYRDSSYVPPAVGDGAVYLAGTNADTLHAFDAATGDERWRFDTGVGVNTSPVVLDDALYVGSHTTLYALDAATGEERWRLDLDAEAGTPLAARDGCLYFGTTYDHPNRVYAVA